MKLLTLFRREHRAMTLRDPDGWRELFGTQTAAGVVVTAESALGHPAVLGAVRLLAELTASLPLLVYERTGEGKRRAEQHPAWRLLHEAPNDLMTPYQLKETLVLHLLTHGNSFLQVVRAGNRPVALWPIHPTRVSIDLRRRPIVYRVAAEGGTVELRPEDVVHVALLADDGLTGRSPVQLAREAIGAALAAEEFAATYFANGAQPSGVLTVPGALTPEAYKRLKESWNAAHGPGRRHSTAVLEQGTKFEPLSSTAEAAQLVESRQFALRLIAAALRIPPHLLDPTARGTYANVETQSLEFLVYSLQPMLTRIEEALSRKLFAPGEPYFCEFLTDGLLRADTRTRYAAYETGIRAGFLTVDEVRQRENLPALSTAPERAAPPAETRADDPDQALHRAIERRLEAAIAEVLRRETEEVLGLLERHLGRRDLQTVATVLRDYYAQAAWMAEQLLDPFTWGTEQAVRYHAERVVLHGVLSGQALQTVQERLARRILADYLRQHQGISETAFLAAAREAITEPEILEAVERAVAEMAGVRPGKAAKLHATILRNEAALEVYREAGVTKIRWVASPGACEYCRRLHGKVVGIGEPFVRVGEPLAGPGGRTDRPMVARYPRVRPPVHLGCTCSIAPA